MSKEDVEDDKAKKHVVKCSCKNCETEFAGNFCPNCGQSTYEYEKPFRILIIDFAGDVFAFDARFWKSLLSLIIKPGRFASDFISGRRARYMPPFRLYIFVSFIFFLLLSFFLKGKVHVSNELKDKIGVSLNNKLNEAPSDSALSSNSESNVDLVFETVSLKKFSEAVIKVVNNPEMYLNTYLKYFSWALFLLMPVYAGILFLLNFRSNKYYYNHLIFSINQHAFIFLLLILLLVIKLILPNRESSPENFLLWTIPIYIYLGSKQLYGKRWFATALRVLFSLFFYTTTLFLTLGVILVFWAGQELF